MLEFDEFKLVIEKNRELLKELAESIHLDQLRLKASELDLKVSEPGFWDNPEKSQKIVQEAGAVKNKIEDYEKCARANEDAEAFLEMGIESDDASLIPEVRAELEHFEALHEELRLMALLTGEFDDKNAIVTLHPGAGGTEACDWTGMLYRMYTRWAEKHGFKIDVMDYQDGDEAGVKSVTFIVSGVNAYGYLRSEHGVHRLVRISPFDASGRRHTSFASCEVMPELDDSVDIKINPDDIRVDTYRSSGAGGQHVNKTSSAIRITHIPTGIVVQCQNERSQFQNKDVAFSMLRAKLYELEREKQAQERAEIRGEVKENAFGSQIRSYVFCPYTMVKDTRTDFETSQVQSVMDGELDGFINAYLAYSAK